MGKNFNENIKANNFVVLDIENPNSRGNSICSIGILIIEDGSLVRKEYSLINPEDRFDRTNSEITGITESMVLDSPTLKEYWQEIGTTLSDSVIVGHNIKYDLSVLSKALYRYDMPVPAFRYICTLDLSHSLLSAPSYKLSSLLGNLGISYDEHNALADAISKQLKEEREEIERTKTDISDLLDIVRDNISVFEQNNHQGVTAKMITDTKSALATALRFQREWQAKEENNLKEDKHLEKIGDEISDMKQGSIALINQITTVSKMRIFDPRNVHGVLSGIALSGENMEKINEKIKDLFIF